MLAEERVRVDDVMEVAPVAPLPCERAQAERLSGAGDAVPEHELAAVRGLETGHEPLDLRLRVVRVVVADFVPRRHGDRPPGRHRPLRPVRPERHGHLVRRAGIRRRQLLPQPLQQLVDRLDRACRRLHVHHPGGQADLQQDVGGVDEQRLVALPGISEQDLAELRQFARRGRPAVAAYLAIAALEHVRVEQSVGEVVLDLMRQAKLVARLAAHPLTLAASSRK